MTTTRPPRGTGDAPLDGSAWIDEALRLARPAAIDDDGFSAAVLARIALPAAPTQAPAKTSAPAAMLAPVAALDAARASERRERRRTRRALGLTAVGAALAAGLAAWAGLPTFETGAFMAPGMGLLVAASCLAYLAIRVPATDWW